MRANLKFMQIPVEDTCERTVKNAILQIVGLVGSNPVGDSPSHRFAAPLRLAYREQLTTDQPPSVLSDVWVVAEVECNVRMNR